MTERAPSTLMLVARREFIERTRTRLFRITTVVLVIMIAGGIFAPKLFKSTPKWKIGVSDQRSRALADDAKSILLQTAPKARITIVDIKASEATDAVRNGVVDAMIRAPKGKSPEVTVKSGLGGNRSASLSIAIQRERLIADAARLGITEAEAFALLEPGEFSLKLLDPPDPNEETDRALAFAAGVLMFFLVLQFGATVAQGVVEEKSSRVLELLLSRMKVRSLLGGKLLGIGAVGLLQTFIILSTSLICLEVSGAARLRASSVTLAIALVAWFVVGYALYSALFLIAGALAGRIEDLQSTSGVATLIAVGSYAAASAANGSPAGTLIRVLSFVPFTAPLTMPTRIAGSKANIFEVIASVLICALTIVILLRIGERVFKRTMFSRGQKSLVRTLRNRTATND